MPKIVPVNGFEVEFDDDATDSEIAESLDALFPEKVAGFGLRADLGTATTPKAIRDTLARRFGQENVRQDIEGNPVFRPGPGQSFHALEEPGLSVSDIADLSGEAIDIAGITAGTILGGGFGAIPGGIGGRALRQLVGASRGVGEDDTTPSQLLKEQAVTGALAGVGEGLGRVAVKGVQKLAAPLANKITPKTKATNEFIKEETGKVLSPAQQTESPTIDFIEEVTGSMMGGGKLVRSKEALKDELSTVVAKRVASRLGPMKDESTIAEVLVRALDIREKALKKPALLADDILKSATKSTIEKRVISKPIQSSILDSQGSPFMRIVEEEVSKKIFPVRVFTSDLKSFVRPMREVAAELRGIGKDTAGDDVVTQILALPDVLDFASAQALKSRVTSMKNALSGSEKRTVAFGLLKKLDQKMHQLMKQSLERDMPELSGVFTFRQKVFRDAMRKAKGGIINRALQAAEISKDVLPSGSTKIHIQNPSAIVKLITQPTGNLPGRVGNVRVLSKLKAAVEEAFGKNSVQWNTVERHLFEDMLDRAQVGIASHSGEKLRRVMFGVRGTGGRGGYGMRFMKTAFPGKVSGLQKLVRALEKSQERIGTGKGETAFRMVQAGTVIGGAFSGSMSKMIKALGTVFFVPRVLARLFTDPRSVKWLTEGFTLPRGSQRAATLAAQIELIDSQIQLQTQAWLKSGEEDRR